MTCKKQRSMLNIFMIVTAMSFCWFGCSQELEKKASEGIDYECFDCNVILIIIDTLRADHLGCYGYHVEDPYYFLNNLRSASITSEKASFVRETALIINDDERQVLFEHTNSQVMFKDVPINKNTELEFGIGISQAAWEKPGDGVLFEISIVDEKSQNSSLFSKYIDPKNNVEDRKWFDEQVDVSAFAGQRVSFVFKTTGGPKDDVAAIGAHPILGLA